MSDPAAPRLLLVTGLSGAGKSTVLKVLEDLGWEVVDNLPLALLDALIDAPVQRSAANRPIAVGIDSRSRGFKPALLVKRMKELREAGGRDMQTLFLDCAGAELERRFSETRRRHPLSGSAAHDANVGMLKSLEEAIEHERELVANLAEFGHQIDTSNLSANALRAWVKAFVESTRGSLMLTFESFGFKRGVPLDADLVFDVRTLPNPHYDARLRPLTGLDQPVIDFLRAQPAVHEMIDDIYGFVARWLPHFRADNRSYLTVAIGCTGGQHRSVHIAQTLATRFAGESNVIVRHRDAPLDVGESSRLIA